MEQVPSVSEAIPESTPDSTAVKRPAAQRGLLTKLRWVWETETGGVHFRLWLASRLGSMMPHFAFVRLRTAVYRMAGVQIGQNSLLLGAIELAGPGPIEKRFVIGDNCQITAPLYADACAPIQIGNRVFIGHHVKLITTNHDIGPARQRCGAWRVAPIRIEDGVWIGAQATILPGVTIGQGAVVAAGAVVTRDVPPNTLVGGIPAKVIRELEP